MKRSKIKEALSRPLDQQSILVKGWIRTVRMQKNIGFIELNDGTCFSSMQVVISQEILSDKPLTQKLTTGSSIAVEGILQPSSGREQGVELHASSIVIIGESPQEEYPLQKKRHSFEFLRTIAHLRPRTNTQRAVARVRSTLAQETHAFFRKEGFLYLQTPIITSSDCEGGGELFRVTTLDPSLGKQPFSDDFFGKATYLTGSGQLQAESYALAMSDVYTFGPTFRAEHSHTQRHLAEFWMIEPEMAFASLEDDLELAEKYLKAMIKAILSFCEEEVDFFDQMIKEGQKHRLLNLLEEPFGRLTYTEAVEELLKSKREFQFPTKWGCDLQAEHERYLAEELFCKPLFVTDYPKEVKAFYMRLNDDEKTVAAMDLLVPGVGEIMGGSQREERLSFLQRRLEENHLSQASYDWYLDLRRFGSAPHAGFGVGFERLVSYLTGVENLRDISPFPRVPNQADF